MKRIEEKLDVLAMKRNDGGLPLPSLKGRLSTMVLRTLIQVLMTKDTKLKRVMRAFVNEERDNHRFSNDGESTTDFLD
jgi:hypothetical protein